MKQYTNFRTTEDQNIVLADYMTTEKLYIDSIEKQIAQFKIDIESVGEPITTEGIEDERVIEMIEIHNAMMPYREKLEAWLAEYEELLRNCENAR